MTKMILDDLNKRQVINYMKQQLRGMRKYEEQYKYNIPYYEKAIELLEKVKEDEDGNS